MLPYRDLIREMTPPGGASHDRLDARVLIALAAASLLIRVIWLASFPEIEADEGLWTNSSKNFVAFGDWFMDGRKHALLSPAFAAASVFMFDIFGASILSARVISALAGTASVVLLYTLTNRLTGRRDLALASALLFGFDEVSVLLSRRALIESFQLFLILGSATLLTVRRWWSVPAAGLTLGLALLAKLNAVFVVAVIVTYLLIRSQFWVRPFELKRFAPAALFLLLALGLAGAIYGGLYSTVPEQFVQAFSFELDGVHFEALSEPILRVGRFALDPEKSARTVIELFRASPFVLVLASFGVLIAFLSRPPGLALFGPWILIGVTFFLGQMFQPLRYFHLVAPAFAFFAAVAVLSVAPVEGWNAVPARKLRHAYLAVFLVFNLGNVGMGAIVNRGTKLGSVVAWAREHTAPTDRIMAAGYFCTDLPNRCYAHYYLAGTPEQLLESIEEYEIDYVVYDDAEWNPEFRTTLRSHFPEVRRWPFGAAYRTSSDSARPPAIPEP